MDEAPASHLGRRGAAPVTPAPLTPTEERILALIREGRVDAEIAVQLGLSVGDLKARVERLMTKTGATSRAAIRPGAV